MGELRSALAAGVMTEDDVHAELGEVVNGDKAGREGNEIIVIDLTSRMGQAQSTLRMLNTLRGNY